jgi:hypothetical protein
MRNSDSLKENGSKVDPMIVLAYYLRRFLDDSTGWVYPVGPVPSLN